LGPRFNPVNFEKTVKNFVDYVIKFTGGPDNYEGRNLQELHKKMNLPPLMF